MTDNPGIQAVPEYEPNEKEHRRKIAHAVNTIMQGRIRGTLDVTLTANTTVTTISDSRIGYFSWLLPMPMTANAAAEIAGGALYIPQATLGPTVSNIPSAIIQHANNSQTDRTFRFLIISP